MGCGSHDGAYQKEELRAENITYLEKCVCVCMCVHAPPSPLLPFLHHVHLYNFLQITLELLDRPASDENQLSGLRGILARKLKGRTERHCGRPFKHFLDSLFSPTGHFSAQTLVQEKERERAQDCFNWIASLSPEDRVIALEYCTTSCPFPCFLLLSLVLETQIYNLGKFFILLFKLCFSHKADKLQVRV